ncbi:MAG: FecR domain-containing protein [Bacteroidales bacterium]|nr:FecR domain-containing protein [Bacteroidales bacterium]
MTGSNTYKDIHERLVRYLAGEDSAEERSETERLIRTHETVRGYFEDIRRIWHSAAIAGRHPQPDMEAAWRKFEKATASGMISIPLWSRMWVRVAAVMLILIMSAAGVWYFRSVQHREVIVSTAPEERQTVSMPDGSLVTLNGRTTLNYPKRFTREVRHVQLEGEGFFEVTADEERPFIINAGDLKITVLGTRLNVKAYSAEKETEVTVASGRVSVTAGQKEVILNADEKAVFDRTLGSLTSTVNRDANYLAWKTRKLVFRDTSLGEIVTQLNRIYPGQEVMISDSVARCRMTATFDDLPLEQIIEVIRMTFDLEVTREADRITITGKGC